MRKSVAGKCAAVVQWPLTRSRQRELLKSFQYLKKETQKTLQLSTFNLGQIHWFQNICSNKLSESLKDVLQRYNHFAKFNCGKSLLFNIWLDVLLLLNSDVTLRRESLQSLSACFLSLLLSNAFCHSLNRQITKRCFHWTLTVFKGKIKSFCTWKKYLKPTKLITSFTFKGCSIR